MKIAEFIQQEIDIDVYDDVCEELAIAFVGPQKLTQEGSEHFSEVLEYEIEIHNGGYGLCAIVHVDDPVGNIWKSKFQKAKEFFESAAGYCSFENYESWFEE